jgi:hypothetical protein
LTHVCHSRYNFRQKMRFLAKKSEVAQIVGAVLQHVANMMSLNVLDLLNSREMGDKNGLWHLHNLKELKSLDIFSGRITDTGCSHIAMIKLLESLGLCGGHVSNLGCVMLVTLDHITSLNLSQNEPITNHGAAALTALPNLKTLNMSNTRVNAAALIHFSNNKGLDEDGIIMNHDKESYDDSIDDSDLFDSDKDTVSA